MAYEGLEEHEYLDLSNRNLGMEGILDILHDLSNDNIIKQINLSYNIPFEEVSEPMKVQQFIRKMKRYLNSNRCLTALDFAGNHLFQFHPHPSNEHIKYYEILFAQLLLVTKITHIDLSDNNMAGYTAREMDGLLYFLKNYMIKGKAFHCRRSGLRSQGLRCMIHCLGVSSSLTYLDLSDNAGGLDSNGNPSSDGVAALTQAATNAVHLRVLKLARNVLRCEEVELISDAIQKMPQFQDLDISGNLCRHYGAQALNQAIISHALFTRPTAGFRDLNLSNNNLCCAGIQELCIGIERTATLKILRIAYCRIGDEGATDLLRSLKKNATIKVFDIEGNLMRKKLEVQLVAEVAANVALLKIETDAKSIDTQTLKAEEYVALQQKLPFLSKEAMIKLHENASFTIPNAEMTEALFLLEPPPRKYLLAQVKHADTAMEARLQKSKHLVKKAEASKIIFKWVFRWYKKTSAKRNLAQVLLEARRREEERDAHNLVDDDTLSYVSNHSSVSFHSKVSRGMK